MEEKQSTTSKFQTTCRLLSYLKPYKVKTAWVITLLLLIMVFTSLMPLLMKYALDFYVIDSPDIKGLLIMGAVLSGMMLVTMFLTKIRIYVMNTMINTVLIDIRRELFTHIQTLSFKFFDSRPVGKILSRVVGDVKALHNLLNHSIMNLIPNFFTVVVIIGLMIFLSPILTLICFLVMPFLFGGMVFIEIKSHKLWKKNRSDRSSFLGFTHEAFSGSRITQSFARESYMKNRFLKHLNTHGDSFMTAIRLQDFFWPVVILCSDLGVAVILFAGFFLVGNGTVDITTLLAFIMYIGMLWRPIMNLAAFYNAFITNLSAAERIFEVLDTENISDTSENTLMPPIRGNIEFKNVTFSYDDDDKHALRNVSFTINPGEKIALVGETGSGKTTITNLISKFYEAQTGKVLIDGMDIREVDTSSIRQQMGIMLQDSFLFSSSIKENILYGKLDATEQEMLESAKAVNVHSFIDSLEKGYDTNVNERGSRLSQGQRQLIAFARALIADPKILILDEATANIDTQTERLVQQGIHKLMEGRTSIVIAHRLSTIRDCDKIFVLSHGKIVEAGTHDELLASGGYYHNLYRAQYKFLEAN